MKMNMIYCHTSQGRYNAFVSVVKLPLHWYDDGNELAIFAEYKHRQPVLFALVLRLLELLKTSVFPQFSNICFPLIHIIIIYFLYLL